jgi:hypothetical protein
MRKLRKGTGCKLLRNNENKLPIENVQTDLPDAKKRLESIMDI